MSDEPIVELNPSSLAEASLIGLHGLGGDGEDLLPLARELRRFVSRGMRFVLPHAPVRPVTVNGGHPMRAWYDIADAELTREEDLSGLQASEKRVRDLIQHELESGFPPGRVMIAGFSQGGALGLYTGLRYPQALGGIAALSAYLPRAESLYAEAHPANARTPILMAHGTQDPVVPLSQAQKAYGVLQDLGYLVDWYSYPMAHTLCAEEIRALGEWLERILGAKS